MPECEAIFFHLDPACVWIILCASLTVILIFQSAGSLFTTNPSRIAVHQCKAQGCLMLPCHFSTAWLLQIRTWIIKSGKKEKQIEKGVRRERERERVATLSKVKSAWTESPSCASISFQSELRWENKSDWHREERCQLFHVIWLLHLIEKRKTLKCKI